MMITVNQTLRFDSFFYNNNANKSFHACGKIIEMLYFTYDINMKFSTNYERTSEIE